MPTKTRRINRLAIQFAQDGHLSLGQKWRNLVMEIFGEEGLIPGNHLTNKTAYCGVFNIEIFRLHNNTEQHPLPLAKRKLFNPFKWIEFIVSLFQFLPWFFHRSVRNIAMYLEDKREKEKKEGKKSTDLSDYFLGFCAFLCICICIPLHLVVYLTLSILKRILAPVRYIIRPSIELYKEHSVLFTCMLLVILFFTALLAWSVLTGSFAFTATLGIQIAAIGVAAIIGWMALLKTYEFFSNVNDHISKFLFA